MARPQEAGWRRLKSVAKYFLGAPRMVQLFERQALRARNDANASIFDGLRSWACDQIALHKAPVPQIKVYK